MKTPRMFDKYKVYNMIVNDPYIFQNLLPYEPFIAPFGFDPAAQTTNIHRIFSEYANTDKVFGYVFSDTINTLTLNVGSGVSYRYGYTRAGQDYAYDTNGISNPFTAGDTKRWVIQNLIGTQIFTHAMPNGSIWGYFGLRASGIIAQGGTEFKNVIVQSLSQLTSIPNNAFDYSGAQGVVSIPSTVTSIGNSAFEGCTSLTGSTTIPSSVTSIGTACFLDCSGLNGTLTLPSGNATVGSYVYSGSNFGAIPNVEATNYAVDAKILYRKSGGVRTAIICAPKSLSQVGLTIASGLTAIESFAFRNCTLITGALTIPSSITTIATTSFTGMSNVTELNLPSGYLLAQTGGNYKYDFSTVFTAASLNQSIINMATATRTITIGATNKARLLAAFPNAETNANARGITIV